MSQSIVRKHLRKITVEGGDVVKFMQKDGEFFSGFGECYFSNVNHGVVKAWKRHLKMSMNLTVVVGTVKFVYFEQGKLTGREHVLSEQQPERLVVPPMIWYGFQGIGEGRNVIASFANMPHSEQEIQRQAVFELPYEWHK